MSCRHVLTDDEPCGAVARGGPDPAIVAARLDIRPLRQADLPKVREILFDRRVREPLGLGERTVRIAVDEYLGPWSLGVRGGSCFLVATRGGAGGPVVGAGRVHAGHIDYFVERDRWGRGIGAGIAAALCSEAFEVLGIRRLAAAVLRDNIASRRILDRLGFREVGASRGPAGRLDVVTYILDRSDGPPGPFAGRAEGPARSRADPS